MSRLEVYLLAIFGSMTGEFLVHLLKRLFYFAQRFHLF